MSQLRHRKGREPFTEGHVDVVSSTKTRKMHVHNSRTWLLLLVVLSIRLFNAFTTKTFFQADEYYQLLEVAHSRVFGYGYITWEWKEKLRSSLHPMVYVIVYTVASAFRNQSQWIIFNGPKIINAIIATIGDFYTYRYAQTYLGNETMALETLGMSIISGFNWHMITRSFSNTLEMVLTAVALSLWSWGGQLTSKHLIACAFGMVTCILRPTNGLLWLYLGGLYLLKQRNKPIVFIIKIIAFIFAELFLVLALSGGLDYWFYGELTFPLYNFIEFNVVKNLSIFYGSAPWHFYIFQGLPILTLGFLPLLLVSFYYNYADPLSHVVAFVIGMFLCVAHKEFRFIYALQPILLVLACKAYHQVAGGRCRKILLITAVVGNVVPAYFFSQINERGVIDIMSYLREEVPENAIVGFLTPCHSTPWQSHLHLERMENQTWFLTCEPPLHLQHGTLELVRNYRDISDQFYDDPVNFLHGRISEKGKTPNKDERDNLVWPHQLIAFEALDSLLKKELMNPIISGSTQHEPQYHECRRFFNSYLHWDPRRRGDLIVYCRDDQRESEYDI
ncbi:glycosylphosphatidylinositol anchor biosynthesis [Scheffersomyces spartinae]|uniref:Mannosyltransferase n=1 Tax=Scheffersomyces spartinae TaxID=45513 RepID=A0A9P7V977_9ASCO|nr:glycosylphosphatidylinositol anchor biosynthesis [Scheffersomyces spartinae]KAG7193163.1 glycosylphosphatidylinositol anchor biosynthesis [Scheffersomyces spartinae]